MTTQPPPSIPIPISHHAQSPSASSQASSLSPVTPLNMPMPTSRNFATSPNSAAGMFRWGFPGSLSKSPNAPSTMPMGSPPTGGGGEDEFGAMAQRHDRSVSIAVASGGVIGEKQARGQGVLRRLSLGGGAGFARPNFLSPPKGPSSALADSPPSTACPTPIPMTQPVAATQPESDSRPLPSPDTVRRAATTGRRRLSENQGNKKRGVSPMGERILRDHGHF